MAYAYDKPKGSKRFYIGYVDARGIGVQERCAALTKTEAKRLAEDKERKCERQRLGLEAMDLVPRTFAETVKQYLEVAAAKSSYSTIEGRFRNHLLPFFGEMGITEITPAVIERFLVMKADELGPQSRDHLRVHLSALFTFAIKKAKLHRGPNPVADVPKVEIPLRDPKHLEAEWIPAVISHVSDRWRPMFATAVYTGLRKGELLGLRVANVDLKRRIILVNRSYEGNTKGKKERVVPIPEELVPYLQVELGRVRSEFLFPGIDGGMQSKNIPLPEMLRGALKRAGIVHGYDHVCRRKGCGYLERRADNAISPCPRCSFQLWPKGVPVHLSFKDLRSTFGTYAFEATGDLRYVQRGLGHRDIATTETRYARYRPQHLVQQADKLRFGTYPALTGARQSNPVASVQVVEDGEDAEENGARPAGLEPTTLGLEGQFNTVSSCNHLVATSVTSISAAKSLQPIASIRSHPTSTATYPALTIIAGESLLLPDDVARHLGVVRDTVYAMVKRGQIRAVRVQNQLRFRPADLEAYLRGGR